MATSFSTTVLLSLGIFLLLAGPAHAFGAGNIASLSAVEGLNWRHGDIEDTLLNLYMSKAAGGKKFDKMMVARVYFGNWLRDYSQAIDVGTVKYVSAEAIRILLWVVGFMTFGYGTKEFEVTAERLKCYRPEDHIDNPKDYADNLDAREYDPRLRGPVNERVELAVDQRRGLKNYIASEEVGITTSAGHVRQLFNESIRLGRSYARSGNKAELYESLRLMGTGCHCLEDFSAHSNYVELALLEMGERDVFPHVGRRTQIRLPGAQNSVFPIITGTFGGVDFLHSMMGEFDDKATQSELTQLQGAIEDGSSGDTSFLKELLSQLPSGLFGGKDQASQADQLQANAAAAQMQQMHVSPKRPEAFTLQMQSLTKEIHPILEWHDEIMQSITEAIEAIPVLPTLIEQVEDQINIFVFSLLAPFLVPLIGQLKTELNQGSSEIIASSKDKQFIVFNDDNCSDPTHSMLSKDHFSNVLNEPAGKVGSAVLKWVVPQLVAAMDDPRVDSNRTCSRIINGVLHHPAQRNQGDDGAVDGRHAMFAVVEQWWQSKPSNEKDELRQQLSRSGVENGENHKPGEHDTGHGSGKPLGMAKHSDGCGAGGVLGDLLNALGGGVAAGSAGNQYGRPTQGSSIDNEIGKFAEEALGGGALGGIAGALLGGAGGSLLGGAFGEGQKQSATREYPVAGGGVAKSYTEVGRTQNAYGEPTYGQAQVQQIQYGSGAQRTEYQQYEQQGSGRGGAGYGFNESIETQRIPGGGFERTTEQTFQRPGMEAETYREETRFEGEGYEGHGRHHGKHHAEEEFRREAEPSYGRPEPPREEYGRGGGGEEFGREEYGRGGGRGGFGGGDEGFREAPREDYRGGHQEERREEFREPPREQYGGGYQEERREEFREPSREQYGGGYQEERREEEFREERQEEQEERREEYEEEREERREESSGGGWFS